MAWNALLPTDDGLLINAPAQIRANWEALALGTDSDLLITNAKCANDMGLVDTKLAQIVTAGKVSGTALTLLPNIPSLAGLMPTANLGSGTANSTKVLFGSQAWGLPKVSASATDTSPNYLDGKVAKSIVVASDKLELSGDSAAPGNSKMYGTNAAGTKGWYDQPAGSLSNVIFCWSGSDLASVNLFGLVEGTVLNPAMNSYTVNYHFFGVYGTTYRTILTGRFVKISGISTITIHAKLWSNLALATTEALLKVDIGGLNNTVKSVESTTPTWVTVATIDVSSLTNGTTYTITISLANENAVGSAYCSGIILTAS